MLGATAVGLLVGIERGWTLRNRKDGQRAAGVRTFIVLAIAGGIAGLLARYQAELIGFSIIALLGLVVALAYAHEARVTGQADATSAVAALATLGLGFLSGFGSPEIAVAFSALVTMVLALRIETHRWITNLDEADLKAAVRFAVIALAVRPFLPDRDMGPFDAWNLQDLWLVVILVTGFSFLGYVADRAIGARHGTILTAFIGGAYSSTAVTQSLSQRLRDENATGVECSGIVLASAVMYVRVLLLVLVLAPRLIIPFATVILPPLLVTWAAGVRLWRGKGDGKRTTLPTNPIALLPALGFVIFVAVAAVAARWGLDRFGEQGIAVMLFMMGSMDVDVAIVTAGGLPAEAVSPWLAAIALAGTILANMSVKLGIALVNGGRRSHPAAKALALSMLALALSIAFWWHQS
nr:DUF4010 domain-containing protein [Erythrobacter ani]